MVKFVESEGEWMELMEQSKEKLVVVDFTASW
jgi:thiol:disulfide interchange protein